MLNRVTRAFRTAIRPRGINPRLRRDHQTVKKDIARGVVRRVAPGNVRLQRGQYLTREDMDQRLELLKGYKFDEKE